MRLSRTTVCSACAKQLRTEGWLHGTQGAIEPFDSISIEMTLRERTPGSGLQVLLERDGVLLVGKLDSDVQLPGTVLSRVGAHPSVMVSEPGYDVASRPDVIVGAIGGAFHHVHPASISHVRLNARLGTCGSCRRPAFAASPLPPSPRLRRDKPARQPSREGGSLVYRAEARPKGERRLVSRTGIEPV